MEIKESFFAQYSHHVAVPNADEPIAFKEHLQFHTLVDTLSRKHHHHAWALTDFSSSLYPLFLQAFAAHLATGTIPATLQQTDLLYLNLENAIIPDIKQLSIEKEFEQFRESLAQSNKPTIVMLSRLDIFAKEAKKTDERFLKRQIDALLSHPNCRLVLLSPLVERAIYKHLEDSFTPITIPGPTDADIATILKHQRTQLEDYHHVIIPDDLLTQTHHLAERFLSASDALDSTLLLLDSSAARAGAAPKSDSHEQIKPVLTLPTVTQVLSTWTHVPASHLTAKTFHQLEFTQGLQKKLFGQEAAISLISHELQQSQVHLAKKAKPYSSFLFCGDRHTGKKSMAVALAEQLFNHAEILYFAQPSFSLHPIADIKVQRSTDKHYLPITDVIQQTPYAIFFFEQVDQASSIAIDGLQEIISTGMLNDDDGNQYDFRQAIIILSTTVGASHLNILSEPSAPDDDIFTMDLMQLVMHDAKDNQRGQSKQYSPQELVSKLLPDLSAVLPPSIYQQVATVPFMPLDKAALEKIMRLKLKAIHQQLQARYDVELGYAPEVIRYLTNLVLLKRETDHEAATPDAALKQLYACIEQAILAPVNNKQGSKQLFLQLNETGQLLRCDWLIEQQAAETALS